MKATLESTDKIVNLNGVPARIWEGKTDSGIKFIAFVTRLAVNRDADCSQFDKELKECRPISPENDVFSARMIL